MRFYVTRPHATKPGRFTDEWLKGDTTMADAPTEARALLEDPKDTIVCVKVFNDARGFFMPATFAKGWTLDGSRKLKAGEEQ